jgi:hypothetical protein
MALATKADDFAPFSYKRGLDALNWMCCVEYNIIRSIYTYIYTIAAYLIQYLSIPLTILAAYFVHHVSCNGSRGV